MSEGVDGQAVEREPDALKAASRIGEHGVRRVLEVLPFWGWSRPRLAQLPERDLFVFPRALEVLLGALGLAVFFITVYAGIAGTDGQSENLAPTMVYVVFWVGVPFASLLFGNVFAVLSPWRALGRATGWIAGRFGEAPEPLEYPERLGRIPAAAGIFGFAICELCWASATEPGPLAILMLLYFVAMLVGMSLYGVEAWTRNADAFGVLFGLIGALAPLGRRADGRLYLRVPFTGAARLTPVKGTIALLVISVGSTAFDGAKEGALFNDLAQDLQTFFHDLGFSLGLSLELAFVVGLAGAVAIVGLIWAIGMAGMKPPPSAPSRRALARALRPHADPDRRRLPRRPLLLAAGLQRPGRVAARQRPAGQGLGPVRRRRGRRSTTASSRPRASGTSRSARSCSGTSPRSCSPTTARSSSTARPSRRRARRLSCWFSWWRSPASASGSSRRR